MNFVTSAPFSMSANLSSGSVSNLSKQQTLKAHHRQSATPQWLKVLITCSVVALLMLLVQDATAAGVTDEFTDVATKFEGWISGNLGKLAALVALSVGAIVAAVKKDWSWFFGAVVLSIGIGIMITIITKSFTATI